MYFLVGPPHSYPKEKLLAANQSRCSIIRFSFEEKKLQAVFLFGTKDEEGHLKNAQYKYHQRPTTTERLPSSSIYLSQWQVCQHE